MAPTTGNGRHSHYNSSKSIPITPLHRIPYIQGGYAPAAPLFVTQPRFVSMIIPPGPYVKILETRVHGDRVRGRIGWEEEEVERESSN